MKIAYLSNYKEISGYSFAARGYINALKTIDNIDLVTRNISLTGRENDAGNFSEYEKKDLTNVDCVFMHTLPKLFCKVDKRAKHVGVFAWETDKLPKDWIKSINKNTDAIIVFNNNELERAKNSGIKVPVFKINHSIEIDKENATQQTIRSECINKDTHIFYSICEFNPRKNIKKMVHSYLNEFKADENVVLFLHVLSSDAERVGKEISNLIEFVKNGIGLNNYPPILVNTTLVGDDFIMKIHDTGDTFISISHQESWGIPAFFARAMGKGLVLSKCDGYLEYIDNNDYFVDSYTEPVFNMKGFDPSGIYTGESNWNDVRLLDVMKKMRELFNCGKRSTKIDKNFLSKYAYRTVGISIKSFLSEILNA